MENLLKYMTNYYGERRKLEDELRQANRDSASPVFTSAAEWRIIQKMDSLDRQHNPNWVGYDPNSGPLSRLPAVDL